MTLSSVTVCPGAVCIPSRSVNTIVPFMPVTGPKAAARSMSRTVNSPVEVTLPSPDQLIRPWPLRPPLTSAITPSVMRLSSSGCRFSPKVMPGTSSTALPSPVARLWAMVTSETLVPLAGWLRVPVARIIPSARANFRLSLRSG